MRFAGLQKLGRVASGREYVRVVFIAAILTPSVGERCLGRQFERFDGAGGFMQDYRGDHVFGCGIPASPGFKCARSVARSSVSFESVSVVRSS